MLNAEGIGSRLREERDRLRISQTDLAETGGVSRRTQAAYEAGQTMPSLGYLSLISAAGIDVGYVLNGRASAALAPDEDELLRRYRAASPEVRAVVLAALGATPIGERQASRTVINGGEQGQVFGGDQVNHQPVTFNVGGKKRGKRE
jgi:transcriptional regulator with XRE-family HTH domain